MPAEASRRIVFITSPLEAHHVDRIRAVDPDRIEIIYRPEILPPVRYVADHHGARFTRGPEQQRLWNEALALAEVLWDLPPTRADIAAARRLRWIQATSSGIGPAVERLGLLDSDVIITTARGIHAGPLAEFVFMALLLHVRGLRHLEAEQRAHSWRRYCGEELAGKTLLTIGAGDLARRIAEIGRAFGMHLVGIARDPARPRAHAGLFDALHDAAEMPRVLPGADAVVLTLPETEDTANIMGDAMFAACKAGVVFINIGRGRVVDEAALIRHLQSGRIGFAALDVAATEPLPADSPLWDMPNVLISPHSASTVRSENEKLTSIFCDNLRCYLDGRVTEMRNIFDRSRMY
jgi:phosphoglycerate dehydrogenase-like enzyme